MKTVRIVGAGLAGCEAAYQLLKRGFTVELVEMRPSKTTPAHKTDGFAELVCSNSLKSELLDSSSGLLKAEMREIGSCILLAADQSRVPAGGALAVDRERFTAAVKSILNGFGERLRVVTREYTQLEKDLPTIIATGPLTSDALAETLSGLTGEEYLHFCDAAAPIVRADSVDMNYAFFSARYGKGDADYLNIGLEKEEYYAFAEALIEAKCVEDKLLNATFFEGCMPVEVMAKRGINCLRFGPLRPVGIVSPEGKRFYAVMQLRKENTLGDSYNLVGFQTNLLFPEQKRVFGMLPALKNAEYLRYGVMHRNTFVNAPKLLDNTFMLRDLSDFYIAGQLSGVEGYMESAMSGMMAGLAMALRLSGNQPFIPSENTMIGGLCRYVSNPLTVDFQPMNSNFGLLPSPTARIKDKQERKAWYSHRAVEDIKDYVAKLHNCDFNV